MNPLTHISPLSDAEVSHLAGVDTLADLAAEIASTPAAGAPGRATSRRGAPGHRSAAGRYSRIRRRLIIGVPVAAALAVAGLLASAVSGPDARVGPVKLGPPKAQAAVLSVTRHGGYLDVIVTNPLADARKYRAEFASLGLNIALTLVPASPSLVGTLVYSQTPASIKAITAVGKCYTGGAGSACPVGVRVPLHFKGSAVLTFGRAARPGERYETTAPVTAPGEAMHGMTFVGKPVATVRAMLAARHITVGAYHYSTARCGSVTRTTMRDVGSWYVADADPFAAGQVMLSVSKTWPQPACSGFGRPVHASPAPSASSRAG
ncbi:MAG TPA: hypothetical protein VGI58_15605 [Streptosporangiaceae bacterium]